MATTPNFDCIFDFDGVLADSVPLIIEILDRIVRQERGFEISDAELRATVGPPFRESIARLCAITGVGTDDPIVDEIVAEFRGEYATRVHRETAMFDGIDDAIRDVARHARVSICSSKPRPLIDAIIAAWGLMDAFHDIEAPAPDQHESKVEGLARLLARLAVSPDRAVLVGDTRFDAEAAQANGVRFVGVAWGVDHHEDLAASGATIIAHRPAELPGIIAGLAA